MTRILVTGGAGVLGRELVPRLIQAGYAVRIMSRRTQPATLQGEIEWAQADLETGQGLAQAVSGAQVIVHAATSPFKRTRQIDVDGTGRILDVAQSADVAHLVYVSIVGIDRVPYPYYRPKLAAEALVTGASVPWSILRATQFYNLMDSFLHLLTRFPFVFLPTDFLFQPIDTGEVADRLVECVAAGPSGRLTDMGGPEVHTLGELARAWLAARGLKRRVVRLPWPGKMGNAYHNGYNTCPQHRQGKVTWEEWLRRKYSAQQVVATSVAND